MEKRKKVFALLCLCCLLAVTAYQWQEEGSLLRTMVSAVSVVADSANPDEESGFMDELDGGDFYTLLAEDGETELEYMSRVCYGEDEIITADNKRYKISEVEEDGYKAHCEAVEGYELPAYSQPAVAAALGQVAQEPQYRAVAIYATHTDESYVPSSGTESIEGGGDILDVASVMAETLEGEGVEVLHSENIHDPHDKGAYDRSRETAAELLQEGQPAIIIDVHRDGVPDPNYYEGEVDGQPVTQIRLVVGKANENSEENIAFAEQLKAYYDEAKPGLIKSIYLAKGHYNQDLAPHSILLEVGTHTNTLEEAQAGAQAFAEALPGFLGLSADNGGTGAGNTGGSTGITTQPDQQNQAEGQGRGWGTTALIIAGVLAAGGAALFLFNQGRNGGNE